MRNEEERGLVRRGREKEDASNRTDLDDVDSRLRVVEPVDGEFGVIVSLVDGVESVSGTL